MTSEDARTLPSGFLAGVNLPWLDYGGDFGANAWQPDGGLARPERRERLRRVLDALAGEGIRYLRWFWLCDGRAGLRFGARGELLGLDDRVMGDVESSLELLGEHGLRVMPVLLSFDWLARRKVVNGVQLGGRKGLVKEPALLAERVIVPLLERFGGSPALFAWDLMNEPEWATRGAGGHDPWATVGRRTMRAFLGGLLECVRPRTRWPVTVGLASLAGLGLVQGLGLDFYQVHWYDQLGLELGPERPLSSLRLDRPVVLGEFPSRGSAHHAAELLAAARRSGYAGALAWSVLAQDDASAGPGCAAAVAAWVRRADGPLLA